MPHTPAAVATPANRSAEPAASPRAGVGPHCALCRTLPAVPFVVIQHPDGCLTIESIGVQLERFYGKDIAESVRGGGGRLLELIHPHDLERLRAEFVRVGDARASETARTLDVEFRLSTGARSAGDAGAGGQGHAERWLHVRAVPSSLADGNVRWSGIATDATHRRDFGERFRDNELRLSNTARNIPGAVLRYGLRADGSEYIENVSPGSAELWEVPLEEAMANPSTLLHMLHADDGQGLADAFARSARTLEPWHYQWRITTPSGRVKWLEGAGQPQTYANEIVWDTVVLDVTDRVIAERRHQRAEALYRLLAENTSDLIVTLDAHGVCEYVSPSARRLLGVAPESLAGTSLLSLADPDDAHLLRRLWDGPGPGGAPATGVFRARTADGGEIHLEGSCQRLPADDAGSEPRWLLSCRDVSERVRMEQRLRHDATHDLLTGLPNRTLLEQRLTLALQRREREPRRRFAVLFIDLDRFKLINDSLGHRAGDALLIHFSRHLVSVLRRSDMAARLSGDEFVVLLEDVGGIDEVLHVVERLQQQLREPLEIQGRPLHASASVGIVLSEDHYDSASALLRDADIAMYRAKGDPARKYTVFDPHMHAAAVERLQLESDLRRAVHERTLEVHYQPIIELGSGRVAGVEALVRWHHPERGFVPPMTFVAMAEENGLIVDIDDWVLGEAMTALARWRRLLGDAAPDYVSVNLSARDLLRPDLLTRVQGALEHAALPPSALQLEVTESMLISNFDEVRSLIGALTASGVRISLDDFGTGYSSLAYLHRLPVQCIKADRSFVAASSEAGIASNILRSICVLSESLGVQLIAEGVETTEQATVLALHGYRYAQGFHLARPMPGERLTAWLAQHLGVGAVGASRGDSAAA